MAQNIRPHDSTLRTLEGVPLEYVRLVLEQLSCCDKSLGPASVRICLSSEGNCPHYRIDAIMDLDTGETTNWEWFSGRTHRPLSDKQRSTATWSNAQMTFRQVSDLIGEIRNYSKRKPSTNRI